MNKLALLIAANIAVVGTPAIAQECSELVGYARQQCQAERNQRIEQEHAQDQSNLDRSATANPELARRLEETRVVREEMDCNDRHRAAGEYSPTGMFPECTARRNTEEAALNANRRQDYLSQQQAQVRDSQMKFHYQGKLYVDPAILQAYSMGVGNYGELVGQDVVVGMVPITQVTRRGAKYWSYMGAAAVCVSDTPVAISTNVPVSVSGRIKGTVVSTVTSGDEQVQMNTVVIDECRVGPPVDEDQLWAQVQRGQ